MIPQTILVCHNHYAQRGGEALVFDSLVRGLEERGHCVIRCVRDSAEIAGMSFLQRARVVADAYTSASTSRALTTLVSTHRPSVAIVQNVFPLLSPSTYTTLNRLGIPIVQATYNYRLICPSAELYCHGAVCERPVRGNYLHCVARRCYRNSALASAWYASVIGTHRLARTFHDAIGVFQVPDQFMADKLVEGGLPRGKMVTNVNPFFVRDYEPVTRHDGYILFAGRLVPQKGVATLIDAIARTSHARLVVVGDGPQEAELRAQAHDRTVTDRVRFAGPVWGPDLAVLMTGACAVAVPSEWYDNLPLVLCQANATGKPVIASRINGIPEYVEEGVNGFLFAPGHADQLSVAIDRVLDLEPAAYAALATGARTFAEQHLDFETHYRILSGIFSRLERSAA